MYSYNDSVTRAPNAPDFAPANHSFIDTLDIESVPGVKT